MAWFPGASGSAVVAGSARIRADRVGGDAYAARLQAQARRFGLIRSELQQGTNQILRLVTWVMIPAGLLLIASEFLRSHDPLRDAARGSAAGVVAMVPEGLVLLTSLAFAAGALRLARRCAGMALTTCRPLSRPTWASRWARAARPAVRWPGSCSWTGPSPPSGRCSAEADAAVVANIERVAGLFVAKTVYAAIIAVAARRPESPTPSSRGT